MRFFLIGFFIIFLPVIVLNVKIDPAGILSDSNHLMTEISREIAVEKQVKKLPANFDYRSLHKGIVNFDSAKNKIVVAGSSRAHFINSNIFPGNNIKNHGMGGATLFDLIGIYQSYRNKGKAYYPEIMILGIDEWFFIKKRTQNLVLWIPFFDEIQTFFKKEEVHYSGEWFIWFQTLKLNNIWNKIKTIISITYFENSIKHLYSGSATVDSDSSEESVYIHTDGHLQFPEKLLLRSKEQSLDKINQTIRNFNSYILSDFKDRGELEVVIFQKLILALKKDNIRPIIFLSPHHHAIFDFLKSRPEGPAVNDLELWIRNFAESNDIEVIGSYNPYNVPCSPDEFFDEHHMKEVCYYRIFNRSQEK